MVNRLEEPLITGEIYHVFSKSIAGFIIFNNETEFSRTISAIKYYKIVKPATRFALCVNAKNSDIQLNKFDKNDNIVDIIAYCIMPTHIHFVLKQAKDKGISTFMNNLLNSYTRYFNTKHKRKGPLWESRFKRILVKTDEQLLHLTRYIHLNPVTAYLVEKPHMWAFSSYKEYLSNSSGNKICNYADILDIEPVDYKSFTEERILDQRELAKIKELLFD